MFTNKRGARRSASFAAIVAAVGSLAIPVNANAITKGTISSLKKLPEAYSQVKKSSGDDRINKFEKFKLLVNDAISKLSVDVDSDTRNDNIGNALNAVETTLGVIEDMNQEIGGLNVQVSDIKSMQVKILDIKEQQRKESVAKFNKFISTVDYSKPGLYGEDGRVFVIVQIQISRVDKVRVLIIDRGARLIIKKIGFATKISNVDLMEFKSNGKNSYVGIVVWDGVARSKGNEVNAKALSKILPKVPRIKKVSDNKDNSPKPSGLIARVKQLFR